MNGQIAVAIRVLGVKFQHRRIEKALHLLVTSIKLVKTSAFPWRLRALHGLR